MNNSLNPFGRLVNQDRGLNLLPPLAPLKHTHTHTHVYSLIRLVIHWEFGVHYILWSCAQTRACLLLFRMRKIKLHTHLYTNLKYIIITSRCTSIAEAPGCLSRNWIAVKAVSPFSLSLSQAFLPRARPELISRPVTKLQAWLSLSRR